MYCSEKCFNHPREKNIGNNSKLVNNNNNCRMYFVSAGKGVALKFGIKYIETSPGINFAVCINPFNQL